jgi:hypothetical protein
MSNKIQPVGLIPDRLLANVKKGDCVLFLGADLPLNYSGAPPSRPELAVALAQAYDLPHNRPWPETAQAYLNQTSDDRTGLAAFLRRHLDSLNVRPGPAHRAIARAGFRGIVTAWYDDLLEKALDEAGYRVTRVTRDKQSHYGGEGDREVFVVKLYGSLDDDSSLVLGICDHDELTFRLDRKLELVSGFCQLRPPLFIGFDLADATPRLLYTRALINVVEQDRQAYVVWPRSFDAAQTAWAGRDVHVISASTTPFLEALANQVPAVAPSTQGPIRVDRPPYKFLDYYQLQDADIFCGRDTESQIVTRLTLSHCLLTLFGPSGAGKTSLLLAGVLPRLAPEGYQHVYVRALDDPLPAVRKAIAERAGRADWQIGDDLRAFLNAILTPVAAETKPVPSYQSEASRVRLRRTLAERFGLEDLRNLCFDLGVDYNALPGEGTAAKARELVAAFERRQALTELVRCGQQVRPDIAWDDLTAPAHPSSPPLAATDKLVVVLDQFEELFLRVGSRQRTRFFQELATALDKPKRAVRFVLSLREDYLARLDEARPYLPDIFSNSFRLAPLERANARVAITEPAARAGVTVVPALVDALVGGEGKGGEGEPMGDLVEADGRVPPAALQIVLDRLYRDALPPEHPPEDPPPKDLTLTWKAYHAMRHRLGEGEKAEELIGAEAILAGYVQEGLARLHSLKREDGVTPLGADPSLGQTILKVMVTSQETKAALTHDEIMTLLDEAGEIQQGNHRDRVRAEDTRLGLERVRLLRGFERDGVAYYELAHDHMTRKIATWITVEEMQAKLARDLLRREMDNWRGAGLLIRPEVLTLIHDRRENLKRLGDEERALLLRSALAADYEVLYWFQRACQGGVAVDAIMLEGLRSNSFRTRAAVVGALAELGERSIQPITKMLSDDYPQVRVAAIHALERLEPDGTWRDHLKYECYVPAEEFVMGDDNSDHDNEKPAHKVYLDAFYIGKCPVTNAEYKRYMDDIGHAFEIPIPQGEADHPVVGVSWYDARDYAVWAGMRLPTEAEWEKAATWDEGQKRQYPWGDEFDKNRCNTDESNIKGTTTVGKYSPEGDSPYGVTDMAGNAWEWTSSLYKNYPYQVDDGRENPSSSGERVLRGGSFYSSRRIARCAYRGDFNPNDRDGINGFRCAADPFS